MAPYIGAPTPRCIIKSSVVVPISRSGVAHVARVIALKRSRRSCLDMMRECSDPSAYSGVPWITPRSARAASTAITSAAHRATCRSRSSAVRRRLRSRCCARGCGARDARLAESALDILETGGESLLSGVISRLDGPRVPVSPSKSRPRSATDVSQSRAFSVSCATHVVPVRHTQLIFPGPPPSRWSGMKNVARASAR